MNQLRVLVAGPGYVGKSVVTELLQLGAQVATLSRSEAPPSAGRHYQYDLLGEQKILLPEFDRVVFIVGPGERSQERYEAIFIAGLKKIMATQRQIAGKLIFVSSSSVYSEDQGALVTEQYRSHLADLAETAQVLLRAEAMVLQYRGLVVRFGGIYGPARDKLLTKLLNGEVAPTAKPYFTNRIHQEDAARGIVFLMANGVFGEVYNCVDLDPATRNEMITWAKSVSAHAQAEGPAEQLRGSNKRVSANKLAQLGFEWRYPSFRDGYAALLSEAGDRLVSRPR